MKNIINYISSKIAVLQNLLCSIFVTLIFSIRWSNCLPFSGYMPVLNGSDNVDFFGRYLIYAKEPFYFPIGLIKRLSFPFLDGNISRGSIPLFAILFKFLSKFYVPFSEFYYPVFIEILAVFLTAYFTFLILDSFKIKSSWLKLLGVTLVALSPGLLYRSSNYYAITFEVLYFPIYMASGYFYLKIYQSAPIKNLIFYSLIFPIAALVDYYVLFGVIFLFFICLFFNCLEFLLNKNITNYNRLKAISVVFILGIILSWFILCILGNQGNLIVPAGTSVFDNRYGEGWPYGGGLGGGFHVADVFSVFMPNKYTEGIPSFKNFGPSAYLAKIGFPFTTDKLQDGQYEGFAYIGTIVFIILVIFFLKNIFLFIKNYKRPILKLKLEFKTKLFKNNQLFSLPMIFGLSAFSLYVISWGYIVHIIGNRLNHIVTPSLLIAIFWPKFMFARSLGRLAIPFMLFIIIGSLVYVGRFVDPLIGRVRTLRIVFGLTVILLISAHIYEVKGYLKTPRVTYGNDIANVFNQDDIILMRKLLADKKVLMVVPFLRESPEWAKICYAFGFYLDIPIGGAFFGFGEPPEHCRYFDSDLQSILSGDIKGITSKYGAIAIATPSQIAKNISERANVALKCDQLQSQDVAILTADTDSAGNLIIKKGEKDE